MNIRASASFSVLALAIMALAASPASFAQTAPPAQTDQDHGGHHPDAKAPDTRTPAKQGGMGMMGQGGMMGGQDGMMSGNMMHMMSMMQNMMGMMSAEAGMMAPYVEGRIAALKTELKITDAQLPQWNGFADALRAVAKTMGGLHQQMMQAGKPTTLPEQLDRRAKMLSGHLASLKALEEALRPLYAALSDEQKKIADGLRIGPMGMM